MPRPKGTKQTGQVIAPEKRAKNTDIDKILKQRAKNPLMTITDQAKLNGISKQALSALLQRHGIKADAVAEYKEVRADLLAGKQEMVLRAIDEDTIKRMVDKAPMAAITFFNSCFNNERLERGQSTVNLAGVFSKAMESDQ